MKSIRLSDCALILSAFIFLCGSCHFYVRPRSIIGMDIGNFFNEAYRVLEDGGKLCLVSLTNGTTPISQFVTMIWRMIFQLHATLVGGCCPIRLEQFIIPANWEIEYKGVVIAFGVPSEEVVARTKYTSGTA